MKRLFTGKEIIMGHIKSKLDVICILVGLFMLIGLLPAATPVWAASASGWFTIGYAASTTLLSDSASSSTSSLYLEGSYTLPKYGSTASFAGGVNGGNSPSIFIQASTSSVSGNSDDTLYAKDDLKMDYWFMVVDPKPYGGERVPVTYSFSSGIDANLVGATHYDTWVQLEIAPGWLKKYSYGGDSRYGLSGNLLGNHTDQGVVPANTWEGVSMYWALQVWANDGWVFIGGSTGPGSATVSGFIGPITISIDSSFLQTHPNAYIVFDTLAPPVPAPASLLLLGSGLLGLLPFCRKRFRQ